MKSANLFLIILLCGIIYAIDSLKSGSEYSSRDDSKGSLVTPNKVAFIKLLPFYYQEPISRGRTDGNKIKSVSSTQTGGSTKRSTTSLSKTSRFKLVYFA